MGFFFITDFWSDRGDQTTCRKETADRRPHWQQVGLVQATGKAIPGIKKNIWVSTSDHKVG